MNRRLCPPMTRDFILGTKNPNFKIQELVIAVLLGSLLIGYQSDSCENLGTQCLTILTLAISDRKYSTC